MKKPVLLLSLQLLAVISFAQNQSAYKPIRHFVFHDIYINEAPGIQPSQINRLSHLSYVFNYSYTSCIDTAYNLPIWVSHHIDSDALIHAFNKRSSYYPKDPQYPNLEANAYKKTGYDHGHLAPAADFTWSREAYNQSFYMSNMAPQHACLNRKGWCHLEGTVRKWAEEKLADDFYIVAGAITTEFIDTICLSDVSRIFVPKYFYKVIMMLSPDQNPRSIGFIIPNQDIDNYSIQDFAVTVDSVEMLTKLNFFSFLPEAFQETAESVKADVMYYYFTLSCPNTKCKSIYKKTSQLPEKRKDFKCD
ncbi:DNA/RNA non-specific endonuclease [Candidatus Dojkabacteria bacterium]|nr:DNA/RNA non-specific endonuclease [Candidatus Dojkabacteria bacterium]